MGRWADMRADRGLGSPATVDAVLRLAPAAAVEDAASPLGVLACDAERCTRCGADLPPRPMRRRLRELLPELAGAPLDLCAVCARTNGHARPTYADATNGERSST